MSSEDVSVEVQGVVEPKESSIETKAVEKKKEVPPALKIENVVETGEMSPVPENLQELFKRYQKPTDKETTPGDKMHVEFDQLALDERSGFLRKLSHLSVRPKKKTDGSEPSSPAARLLNKIVPSRRLSSSKPSNGGDLPSRFGLFGRSSKKTSESEKPPMPKKQSARRLQFTNEECVKPESDKNKVVAAMTREYEKISQKGMPVPINKSSKSGAPRGSLETPSDSPIKTGSMSTNSSPEKSEQFPREDRYKVSNEHRTGQRPHRENSVHTSASWHGELPPRDYTSPTFSRKIFVGGVPWDITEAALKDSFGEFGACAVEWPGQEARYRSGQSNLMPSGANLRNQSKYAGQAATGYVYMIFEDERAVASLLHECSQEIGGAGEWYFKIRAQRSKSTEIRQVQIIPWVTSDSLFCEDETLLEVGIEPKRTVFVGALHGMMTAQVLHSIMEDCFGGVECVQLDTDKFKYPIGSGRVTFREHNAYFKAIEIGYLHVHTSKFRKRVQIDPFLESTYCMVCNSEPAHCFCRNRNCFKYYCHSCWSVDHGKDTDVDVHVPVIVPSSATKSYQGPSRRSHLNSPSKNGGGHHHGSSNSSQYTHLLSPAFPMIVGPTGQTLSTLYGYMNNQQCIITPPTYDGPLTPPSGEVSSKRNSREFPINPIPYLNTPVMTPQKNDSSSIPSYFAGNSTTFLTPSSNYYGSPSHSQPQQPYYGSNVYYSYVPPPMPYDGQSYMCSPQSQNYAQ